VVRCTLILVRRAKYGGTEQLGSLG
jgi:hypothetical protein